MPRPTCGADRPCLHFTPAEPSAAYEPGKPRKGLCYGVAPSVVTLKDGTAKTVQPEVTDETPCCPNHTSFANWVKNEASSHGGPSGFMNFDPHAGHNCACVRLGPVDGHNAPNRGRFNRPDGGFVTFDRYCKICGGTGKVAGGAEPGMIRYGAIREIEEPAVEGEMVLPQGEGADGGPLGGSGEPAGGLASARAVAMAQRAGRQAGGGAATEMEGAIAAMGQGGFQGAR